MSYGLYFESEESANLFSVALSVALNVSNEAPLTAESVDLSEESAAEESASASARANLSQSSSSSSREKSSSEKEVVASVLL